MTKEARIMTLHPDGRQGVNILERRYDQIKTFIIQQLKTKPEMSFAELNDVAKQELKDKFDGKIGWYVVTVKLDLEARQIIERIPNRTPQYVRLAV